METLTDGSREVYHTVSRDSSPSPSSRQCVRKIVDSVRVRCSALVMKGDAVHLGVIRTFPHPEVGPVSSLQSASPPGVPVVPCVISKTRHFLHPRP